MVAGTAGGSLTERLYRLVRAEILAGHYAPGQRLRPAELASANQVSLNVVREALNRLAGERLVAAAPHQGFAVAEVSIPDLNELTEVRVLVEVVALRQSIEQGDLAWEADLVAAHHRLTNTPLLVTDERAGVDDAGQVSREWMALHNRFHAATMGGCGNRRLLDMVASLGEAAAIYRYCSQHYDHGRRDVTGEHRAIFEAALARDADLACRLHVEHIRRTADIVTHALTSQTPQGD